MKETRFSSEIGHFCLGDVSASNGPRKLDLVGLHAIWKARLVGVFGRCPDLVARSSTRRYQIEKVFSQRQLDRSIHSIPWAWG
jgi:hypothetical protein